MIKKYLTQFPKRAVCLIGKFYRYSVICRIKRRRTTVITVIKYFTENISQSY